MSISIHAPARGASRPDLSFRPASQFQFTPLREGLLLFVPFLIVLCIRFQFTPLREGIRIVCMPHGMVQTFQFTPLREGLLVRSKNRINKCISIHAPARGASRRRIFIFLITYFNSRPCERGFHTRGTTITFSSDFNSRPCERGFHHTLRSSSPVPNFNSRPCERGFDVNPISHGLQQFISIHAPARGASVFRGNQWLQELFQFTPLREGLRLGTDDSSKPNPFQFTPLREGLPDSFYQFLYCPYISIHAPARGASRWYWAYGVSQHFNSRPCERGFSLAVRFYRFL